MSAPNPNITTTIVVPCFNEAPRFDPTYWSDLIGGSQIRFIFVDDGSNDGTWDCLSELRASHDAIDLLRLDANVGKGNAVRLGMLAGISRAEGIIGFLDADSAFDPDEVHELAHSAADILGPAETFDALWTSRVALAGRNIHRRSQRHYLGRIVATAISFGLPDVPYDTQCGFKLFATSPTLRAILEMPFTTRWLFDVEMLQRWWLLTGRTMRVWEVPLMHWRDVPGSALGVRNSLSVLGEVSQVARTNRRIRRRLGSER